MPGLKTPSVPTVERTLAIFEALAQSRLGMGLAELARRLSVPKSSVHCVLLTMERCGYVHRNERTGRYVLGLKLYGLANLAVRGVKLREQAAPFLHALAERTCLTVHMAILENSEAVLVDRIEPLGIVGPATWVGKRVDVHCTALGKVLAAGLGEGELRALVRERPLLRHNDNTIVSPQKLREELARVRELGLALDDEEEEIGQRCVGAPIQSEAGKTSAAISVSGTTAQINVDNLPGLIADVKKTASDISDTLRSSATSADR